MGIQGYNFHFPVEEVVKQDYQEQDGDFNTFLCSYTEELLMRGVSLYGGINTDWYILFAQFLEIKETAPNYTFYILIDQALYLEQNCGGCF